MLSLLVYNHYHDGFRRKETRQTANSQSWFEAHWVCAASQTRPQFSFIVVNWLEKSEAEHLQNVSARLAFRSKALLFLFSVVPNSLSPASHLPSWYHSPVEELHQDPSRNKNKFVFVERLSVSVQPLWSSVSEMVKSYELNSSESTSFIACVMKEIWGYTLCTECLPVTLWSHDDQTTDDIMMGVV